MALTLITGNRLEHLVERLAQILAQPAPAPLAGDCIVVQSKGMERWARMALARINGICANTTFPFPKAFLEDLCRKCFPDFSRPKAFEPEVLTFRILDALSHRIREPAFESLAAYLREGDDPLKHFEISRKIAHLFDQYVVFRPEWLFSWESGKEAHWQAILWRDVRAGDPNCHQAFWLKRFADSLREESLRIETSLHQVCVFGISYLPPVYLQVLSEIARRVPVYFFLMNPCREYWSDLVSDFEKRRIHGGYSKAGDPGKDLHLEQGNRLLSAWGTQGRQFFSAVSALEAHGEERFQEPAGDTVLSRIQKDIFTLLDPAESRDKKRMQPDSSLRIHACHSPMREMEVLRDALLDLFQGDAKLVPQDILVMAPEIETYAPFIQAVFGADAPDAPVIPFCIADRGIGMEDEAAAGFFSLLSLHETRLGVSRVLELLDHDPIRRRFQLTDSEIRDIQRWVRETRIRWGADAKDRARWGVPAFYENTWEAGLERLLLGYATGSLGKSDVAGVLPHEAVEGESVAALGRFYEFFDRLIFYFNQFNLLKKTEDWASLLNQLLDDFILAEEPGSSGVFLLRDGIRSLEQAGAYAGYPEPLSFPVIRAFLEEYLNRKTTEHRFASGGVTFCTFLPMRSIPSKVICLVGMNDGAFPRQDLALSFNRMALNPRAGDRSRRRDDKYLFLEAVLSARSRLHISYVGLSLQDNTAIPPSVLVTQLVEYLREGYGIAENDVVFRHRLHPFSPSYFRDHPVFFSYSRDDFIAARQEGSGSPLPPFFPGPLGEPPPYFDSPDLERLCRFVANPSAFFFRERLGVFFFEEEALLEDREPFHLDALETYRLIQELIGAHLFKSPDSELLRRVWRLQGRLPHGNVGSSLFDRLNLQAGAFARKVAKIRGERDIETVEGEIRTDGLTLSGRLDTVFGSRLIRHRFARIQGQDLLDTWVRHLFLAAVRPEKPGEAFFLCNEAAFRFRPVKDAPLLLKPVLNLYKNGLVMPARLFPRASFEYAWQRFKLGKTRKEALDRAKKKWEKSEFFKGDLDDPYIERCFRGIDALDESFERCAESLFPPMLGHLEKEGTLP